jgi:hypothetical protein
LRHVCARFETQTQETSAEEPVPEEIEDAVALAEQPVSLPKPHPASEQRRPAMLVTRKGCTDILLEILNVMVFTPGNHVRPAGLNLEMSL